MDKLLNPDTGLVVWTIVTFLTLVFVLKRFAWGPLLSAIEEREERIKADLEAARKARVEAERSRDDFEAEMAGIQARSREMLSAAAKEGDVLRARLKASAEADAEKIKQKTLAELSDEKERLVRELRRDVADLSVLAAERLMRKSVDNGVQQTVLDSFFKELEGHKRRG